jgi:hypothetical protein
VGKMGKKNRYKSLDTLLKLDDEQLINAIHDELVLWLLNKENMIKVVPILKEFFNMEPKVDLIKNYGLSTFGHYLFDKMKNPWDIIEGIEEISIDEISSIYGSGKDEDIQIVKSELTKLSKEYEEGLKRHLNNSRDIRISAEMPVKSRSNIFVGYWDLVVHIINKTTTTEHFVYVWKGYYPKRIYIEVKPKITNFDLVLLELKTYRDSVEGSAGNIYLFTYDIRFKDAFEGQGINIISPLKGQSQLEL